MVSDSLLEILVCPLDHQPLRRADAALLAQLNQRIKTGKLVNRSGQLVERPLEEALVRADGTMLYLVTDGIPIMLADEAVDLSSDVSPDG